MKNTGYIAVAHLFKENHEMITDLRCFLNYFVATLDNEKPTLDYRISVPAGINMPVPPGKLPFDSKTQHFL